MNHLDVLGSRLIFTETTVCGKTCCSTLKHPYSEPTSLCSFSVILWLADMLSREAINSNFIVFGLTRSGFEPTIYSTSDSMLTITPLMWLIWGLKLAAKLNRAVQNCLKAIAGSEIIHKIFFTFFFTTKLKLARYYSCIFANVSISLTLLIRIWNFLRVWYTKCIIMLFFIIYYQDFDYWHKLKHHFDTQTMFLQLLFVYLYNLTVF
jgi:hypothetical protein